MSQFSILLSRAMFAGMFLATVVGSSSAYAETYRAGQFTVTDTTDGYRVCKSNGKCVSLNRSNLFMRDRDNGYRWSTWEIGSHFYSISYLESDASGQERYFSFGISEKYKLIFKGKLISVNKGILVTNRKSETTCHVTNIQSGQLAMRRSPDGESFAGLDNGDSVLLQKKQGNWDYVYVVTASNPGINSLKGWVNSNYLTCPTS